MENGKTPLAAVGQGLLAGVIGNAIFTGYQALEAKLAGGNGAQPEKPPKNWSETAEPAQVGHRIAEGVFEEHVPLEKAETMTNVMHWLFGTSWGAVYGIYQETFKQPVVSGAALATTVMAFDYTVLPAMKLYKKPWEYAPSTLAKDYAKHFVYGFSVAAAYSALDRLFASRD